MAAYLVIVSIMAVFVSVLTAFYFAALLPAFLVASAVNYIYLDRATNGFTEIQGMTVTEFVVSIALGTLLMTLLSLLEALAGLLNQDLTARFLIFILGLSFFSFLTINASYVYYRNYRR